MMKVARLIQPRQIILEDAERPSCGKDEILVHIDAIGICGSDLHFFTDFHLGSARIEGTRVLGHEVCGTVVDFGTDVTGISKGDRVALDPTRGCGHCQFCRSGRENLCTTGAPQFLGNAYTDGAMQEYFVSPANKAFRLPSDCPPERACLLEPFSVALHAVRRAAPAYGDSAVILGSGCIGLMCVLALKEHGIQDITVVDLVESRLEKAKELGATRVINGGRADTVETVLRQTGGEGANLILETAGSRFTQAQSIPMLKKGGTIVLVGMSSEESVALDINTLLRKEGKLFTVFRFTTEFAIAATQVGRYGTPLEAVVSNRYPLSEVQCAFEESIANKDQIIKAVITT